MAPMLDAGRRTVPKSEATYVFDEETGQFVNVDEYYIHDQVENPVLAFYPSTDPAAVSSDTDWIVQV
jgi:hypothetical protein